MVFELVDSHCHLDFPDFAEELPQIIAPFAHLLKRPRAVARQLDPQFGANGDGKAVDLHIILDARRLDIGALAVEFLHHPLGHGRTNGVMITAKQHRMRKTCQDQPPQCRTQIKVNKRRAVSISTSALPDRRSCNTRAPSLWMPRRAISMASIWLGGKRFTASK